MKLRKLLSVLLTLSLLASLLCLSALPAAAAEVSDWVALADALAAGGDIRLTADVTAPAARTVILTVPAGVTATLDLNGFTLDGGTPGEEDCVVLVFGTFTLADSSAAGTGRITGTRDAVDVIGGAFTLSGGTVDACGNYGVAVVDGTGAMTGGAVRDCGRVGVFVQGADSRFVLSGGAISGSLGFPENGLITDGSGFEVWEGSAEIAGGVISGNIFGVKVVHGALKVTGGEIAENIEAEIPGGAFGGAGIYAYDGAVEVCGGTLRDNDYAGLYIDVASEACFSGGAIVGGPGNGVVVTGEGARFRMTGGTISGCTGRIVPDENRILYGDGVVLYAGCAEVSGGEIAECLRGVDSLAGSAAVSGGEIARCVWAALWLDGDGALSLSGSPVFTDNNIDLLLRSGKTVTVGGPFAPEAPLSVAPEELLQNGGERIRLTEGLAGNGSAADCFALQSTVYELVTGDDGEAYARYVPFFPDVTGREWYAIAASYAAQYGIFEGTDKGFEGSLKMTNAMAVQALWNHAGKPEATAAGDGAWYAAALAWAEAEGFVPDAAAFEPNAPITREALCALCYRYLRSLGYGCGEGEAPDAEALGFPDAGDVSADALEAMAYFVRTGVINGMGGLLNPRGAATRAQTATILLRMFNYIEH